MLGNAQGCAVVGLEGLLVQVEVDISPGLPAFHVVGLGDAAVQESRERVRAAIRNSGLEFPFSRVTVSLAPADLRKAGPAYDLPIAVALLQATGQLRADLRGSALLGELALDGRLRHTDGVLPMAAVARRNGLHTLYVPQEDAAEAALVTDLTVVPLHQLSQLVGHLSGRQIIAPFVSQTPFRARVTRRNVDLADVRGQEHAKRALEVAAAGGHNLLLHGTPGSGKTMLARALHALLPPLEFDEALEVTRIYSVAGQLPRDRPLIEERPFCAPHYTTSLAGLVGGGAGRVRPGLVTLAHRGLLFLDELPEFGNRLEVLRQPLEDRVVTLSRAVGSVVYPAHFLLVAAQNPCPCGWHGDRDRPCSCSPALVTRYQRRVSGPLLDRIDIHVEVPRVAYEKLAADGRQESSEIVAARVAAARSLQQQRLGAQRLNSDMGPADVRCWCRLDAAGQELLRGAATRLHLSARSYHRVLRLARTIADLAGHEQIAVADLAESLQYRPRQPE